MSKQSPAERGAEAEPVQRSILRLIAIPVIVLVIAIVGWWAVVFSETPPEPGIDQGRVLREDFYAKQIEPLMKATERANQQAAERAVDRAAEVFDKYRGGIKPFTEDITSIGTRFGILRRMPANWWYEDERINAFIQEKFETHLFSEEQFHRDISNVLKTLKEDLQANENRLLGDVRAAVESGDMPDMTLPDDQRYEKEVREIILKFSEDRATDSVYQGIATLVLAEVAAITAHQIVVRILMSVGTSAATSAAAGGGATAGGAASGSAVGSLGGPVGTAIGVGVGLVVGVIVDWWMTERFKERLANDLNTYLDELQAGLLDGTENDAGLKTTLNQFVDDLSDAQDTVVRRTLVEGS